MESICLFLSGQGFDEGNWPHVDQPKRKNKTIRTQRIFLNASLVLFFMCVCFMLYEKRWHFPQIERTSVSLHLKKKKKNSLMFLSYLVFQLLFLNCIYFYIVYFICFLNILLYLLFIYSVYLRSIWWSCFCCCENF